MARMKTDLCIIGAGSGGLSLAAGAVQMGARVVLVEGHRMGGDCLNYGCVPSKALLAAAKQAQTVREGGFGIAPVVPQVDYAAAMAHVQSAIATIAPHDSVERFEGLGVRVIQAWGRFLNDRELEAGGEVIRARRFVIATGSRPLLPPIPGLDQVPYLTNETLFDLRERPGHLLIIGGGPIGMEMAQANVRLGTKVTVIEGDRALNRDDPELAKIVLDRLRAEGVGIAEGAQATRVSGKAGAITVETGQGSFTGTHLLVAVGRTPALDRLNLAAACVETTRAGVKVGPDLRSTNRRVYAIGDAAGGLQFTHVAGYHAGVVIRPILLGLPASARTAHIPRVTYTDPELAQIGPTEAEARAEHGARLSVARFAFSGNDRAIATGQTDGLIKVMVVKGRPVGVSIAGAEAGELIGPWTLALANNLKMTHVANMVAPYPTLGEVNKRAAGAYFSPRLFENPWVKRVVRVVQRLLP
ncbi:dihydrolipoyl dehydrogenase family protein [Rhodovulum euryhalinum]|uniref:Pyruvate/2-oxoglutarate dehydrogenase complex dihydrolipoamide dehydrogenase (E3) component n=1 Tax=Rhodovulum euryhalinum TaxID=35805 RepID=A0A4R2KXZ5_9RHOB|nr:FAD-dependent oxidoreductase [Rhodovulum euryhalinum]TCO71545.1 pyruvate/2-oxoglutarate dehydrogenase complex dihydrolipoamide dehydrogenase (E3) component [Rhodovulum euryhalinum]